MNKIRETLRIKHYPEPGLPEGLQDFGFHYADHMDDVANVAAVMEHYNMWPEDGSYFDQNTKLISDALRHSTLTRHIERTEFSKARNNGG